MIQDIPHIPVLYREVLAAFDDVEDGIIVDCTMGYGGHSALLLENKPHIKLIGIDQDQTAIDFSTQRLSIYKDRVSIKKGRFSKVIKEILEENEPSSIKGILADIGVSSLQLDQKERGFSYESDTLDMRMDKDAPLSALEVVNGYSVVDLERILRDYGEIRNFKQVAAAIVAARPFYSAKALSEKLHPLLAHGKKIHPATLLMQAIRIEVNSELFELESLLHEIEKIPLVQTDVAIISFHSLEDRIVKQKFNAWAQNCICPSEAYRCTCSKDNAIGKAKFKKPLIAQNDELKQNPRSRSAKLRVFKIQR